MSTTKQYLLTLTKRELKKKCKNHNLPTHGTKNDIIERLLATKKTIKKTKKRKTITLNPALFIINTSKSLLNNCQLPQATRAKSSNALGLMSSGSSPLHVQPLLDDNDLSFSMHMNSHITYKPPLCIPQSPSQSQSKSRSMSPVLVQSSTSYTKETPINISTSNTLQSINKQITVALKKKYPNHLNLSKIAIEYINDNFEDIDELRDDLECGYDDCSLTDEIITISGLNHIHIELWELINSVVDGTYYNKKTKTIVSVRDFLSGINMNSNDNNNININITQNWLNKQHLSNTFDSYYDAKELIKLFKCAHSMDSMNIISIIFSIYAQWKFNYMLHKIRNNKRIKHITINDFIARSSLFKLINNNINNIISNGLIRYERHFSPIPVIGSAIVKINDNLYEYCKYVYIFNEIINNLFNQNNNSKLGAFQIDCWIIPQNIDHQNILFDDAIDNRNNNDAIDSTILDINKRLKLDENLKYSKISTQNNKIYYLIEGYLKYQHKIPTNIINICSLYISDVDYHDNNDNELELRDKISCIISKMLENTSQNRIICIIDRRKRYYDLMYGNKSDYVSYYQSDDYPLNISIIKPSQSVSRIIYKLFDDIYIYSAPAKYSLFSNELNSIEHSISISNKYLLPESIVLDPSTGIYNKMSGARSDFNWQMFMISFKRLSSINNDIIMNWFINGWNMRITEAFTITKYWSNYFKYVNVKQIDTINKKYLSNWKLNLKSKTYSMYETELLQFSRRRK